VLVVLHAPQYVVEHLDCSEDVAALIKHDAIGSLRHCGVSDFCP
jgi:diketogulonate reductase-like aldo/keto reductase